MNLFRNPHYESLPIAYGDRPGLPWGEPDELYSVGRLSRTVALDHSPMKVPRNILRPFGLFLVAIIPRCAAAVGVSVEVSPVVHVGASFSVMLTLPPPVALKRGHVETEVWDVDSSGEVHHLVKRKLPVSSGRTVNLHHELEGLVIGYVSNDLFLVLSLSICTSSWQARVARLHKNHSPITAMSYTVAPIPLLGYSLNQWISKRSPSSCTSHAHSSLFIMSCM